MRDNYASGPYVCIEKCKWCEREYPWAKGEGVCERVLCYICETGLMEDIESGWNPGLTAREAREIADEVWENRRKYLGFIIAGPRKRP